MRRRRKWLVVLAVLLAILVVVPAILFVAYVHNPFEGSVESLDHLVPREVSLFTRKVGLGADVDSIPTSPFVERLEASSAFKSFLDSPEWRDADARFAIADNLRRIEDLRAKLPVSVDLESNLLELAIAANPSAGELSRSDVLVLARVGWKVRAAYNLLDTGFVRSRLDPSIEIVSDEIAGYHELHFKSGGKSHTFFFSRVKDVIGLSNKPEMIQSFVSLGRGGAGLSLAFSEDYRPPAPGDGGEADTESEPAELFFSLTRGAERLKLDNFWQQFEKNLLARVALDALGAKFLDRVEGQLFLSEPPYSRARISFKPEVKALHEKRILTRPPLAVADVVSRFGPFVPRSSLLFLFFRCDSRTVFDLISTQLKAADKKLVDDALAKTEFKTLDGLLDRASAYFGDEIALVASRRDFAKLSVKQKADPLPAFTLLWRVSDPAGLEQFLQKIEGERFAVDEPQMADVGGLRLHTALSKLDGGKIAYGVVGDVFLGTSSFDFVERIAEAHANPSAGLAADDAFQKSLSRLSDRANVFAHVDLGNALDWAGDYKDRLASEWTEIKESRFIQLRQSFERELQSSNPGRPKEEIDAQVDARIAEIVQRRKNVEIPTMVQKIERTLSWLRLLSAFGLSLRAEGEEIDARAVLQFE